MRSGEAGLSVFGTVRAMREQRMMQVQTFEQYQYIYSFMKMLIASYSK